MKALRPVFVPEGAAPGMNGRTGPGLGRSGLTSVSAGTGLFAIRFQTHQGAVKPTGRRAHPAPSTDDPGIGLLAQEHEVADGAEVDVRRVVPGMAGSR